MSQKPENAGQGHGRGNHTPGPWVADNFLCDDDHALRIAMPNVRTMPGATIAMAEHNWHDAEMGERRISWKEATANARLIAAAPDLLADLEFAVKLLAPFGHTAQVERMRQTIAKARGV